MNRNNYKFILMVFHVISFTLIQIPIYTILIYMKDIYNIRNYLIAIFSIGYIVYFNMLLLIIKIITKGEKNGSPPE